MYMSGLSEGEEIVMLYKSFFLTEKNMIKIVLMKDAEGWSTKRKGSSTTSITNTNTNSSRLYTLNH